MSTRSLPWRWPVSRFGLFVLDRRKWDANPLDFGMCADVMAKVRHRFPFHCTVLHSLIRSFLLQ